MEDNEVIKRCKQGEKDAFEVLIKKYHPFVYRYICRISEDDPASEDLVQETFIKMIRGIDKYDINGSAKFSTYLITIAKNCYIDYYRREKKRSGDISIEDVLGLEGDEKSLQDMIADKLHHQSIFELIEQLPPEQRVVIKLKYFEELTLKEIGCVLDMEPKTIKSRIHNGMVKLRKLMKGGSYNEGD